MTLSLFLSVFLVHSGSFLGQRSQEPDPRPQWDRHPDLSSQRRAQTEDHLVRQWSPHREWVKWHHESKTEKYYISHKLTSKATDGNREYESVHRAVVGIQLPNPSSVVKKPPVSRLAIDAPEDHTRKVDDDTVILSNVQSGSSAVYQCNASNEFGYLMANAFVNVLGELRSLDMQARGEDAASADLDCTSFRSWGAKSAHSTQQGVPGHRQQPRVTSLCLLWITHTNHHMVMLLFETLKENFSLYF